MSSRGESVQTGVWFREGWFSSRHFSQSGTPGIAPRRGVWEPEGTDLETPGSAWDRSGEAVGDGAARARMLAGAPASYDARPVARYGRTRRGYLSHWFANR